MHPCNTNFEYVAIYVDDLLITCNCPDELIQTLKNEFNLKIKGDGLLEYHLGCDYFLDPDGTLVALPKKYITKILDSHHKMSPGANLPHVISPLEKNDHPELDNTDLASEDLISKYVYDWTTSMGYYIGEN